MAQSTTKKGDALEEQTFNLLKLLLNNDEFYVPGKRSQVFLKKKYFGEKRKGDIIFDVSIETTLPGAESYSILTLVECKNCGRPIEVGDLHEFDSKISEVREHSTKGLLVTTTSLQESAYNYALSSGIGVIRITGDDSYEWISFRKDKRSELTAIELFSTESTDRPVFAAEANCSLCYSFSELLIALGVIDFYIHKEKFIKVPYIAEEKIDSIISRLYTYNIADDGVLSVSKLSQFLSEKYPITIHLDQDLPSNVHGKIVFEPLNIFISPSLTSDEHRLRFTFAHEVGHLILHKRLLEGIIERVDTDITLSFASSLSNETSRRIEYQANLFAGHLLLPKDFFLGYVFNLFKKYRINKGYLYVDHQLINQRQAHQILLEISHRFNVSVEVAKIRLIQQDLLKDKTDNSLRGILKRNSL
jgi:Zn-dependent peptidase ImmA (M78 family)